jgi:HlyD family secretion protein
MTSRFAAALAVVACAGLACNGTQDPGEITASGHVEATQVRVAAKTPGTLSTLSVDEGDRVTAGQTLAAVDTVDVELALATARAERGQAEAELRLRAAGSRKEDIAEARAQVARAAADLDGAEKDLARMEGLLAAGSGTPKSRDDARVRRDAMAAALTGRGPRKSTPRARAWPRPTRASRSWPSR